MENRTERNPEIEVETALKDLTLIIMNFILFSDIKKIHLNVIR